MAPIIAILASSAALAAYDRYREQTRHVRFTAVQMMTIILFMEVKKLTYPELAEKLDGRGGQVVRKNLGMPMGKDGRYLRPSNAWISTFRNHDFMMFCEEFEREMSEHILAQDRSSDPVFTADSTPLEASRYSEWADFNPHYRIKMAKDHIIMVNGIPLFHRVTNGNKGDNPELRALVKRFGGTRLGGCFLTDGGYDSCESYIDVYLRTGTVMSSNVGVDGVIHPEANWKNVLRRYNRLHREPNFKPSNMVTPDFVIRFLANHGERELAGWFLRNLDIMRGDRIHAEHARMRHVCETVHHAMKRWVDFDVRGLHKKYVGRHIRQKVLVCQLLCLVFVPYEI